MADGVVYAYANLGGIPTISLYALDASSGAFKWAYKTSYYPSYPVTVADGVVYAVGNREGPNASGILYALDAKTGALLCNSPLPGGHYYTSPPAVAGGLVYLGAICNVLNICA